MGMEEEKIENILNGNATSEYGTIGEAGYGFGLALVHHLLEKASGRIEVESELGVGTEFRIYIPLR